MRIIVLAMALFACALAAPAEARRCTADSIAFAGFESLSGARIAGVVGGLEAGTVEARIGGNVIASAGFSAGAYQLDLPPAAPEASVELRARGSGDLAFVELASFPGTLQQLVDEADVNGIARIARVPNLALSPESTARYSLVLEALDGAPQPPNECALATLEAALDPDALRTRAAVIQILIDQASVTLRAKGTSPSTLEVVSNPTLLQDTIDDIETASPGLLAATVQVLATPFCSYFEEEALLTLKERLDREWMNVFSGQSFENAGGGIGRHTNFSGTEGYTFSCEGDQFTAELDGTRVSTSFQTREVNGQFIQVQAEERLVRIVLTRVTSAADRLVVGDFKSGQVSYPLNPTLDTREFAGESRQILIRQRTGEPFSEANAPGEYLFPTALRSGIDNVANRVRLDPGGGGEDLDAEQALSWEVNAAGELELTFADRAARLIPLRDEAPGVRDAFVVTESDGGPRLVTQRLLLRRTDVGATWADAEGVGDRYLQVDGRTADGGTFAWLLRPDRNAPAISSPTQGDPFVQFTYAWSVEPGARVVLRLCNFDEAQAIIDREPNPGECTGTYRRRSWELYAVHQGLYYVHEIQEAWQDVDPASGTPPNAVGPSFNRPNFYSRSPLPD